MFRAELIITAKTTNIKLIKREPDVLSNVKCTYCQHKHDNPVDVSNSRPFTNDKGELVSLIMKCRNCDKRLIIKIKEISKQKENRHSVCLFECNGCEVSFVDAISFYITSDKGTTFTVSGLQEKWEGRDVDGKRVCFSNFKANLIRV